MSENTTGTTTSTSLEGLRALEANLEEVLNLLDQADRRLVEAWQNLAPDDPAEARVEELMGQVFAPAQALEDLLQEVQARIEAMT